MLTELNKLPSSDERMPSPAMVKVIEYLVHPDHFRREAAKDRRACIERLRDTLKPYSLDLAVASEDDPVRLVPMVGEYISTAVERTAATRTVTFTPLVFRVPDATVQEKQVSVMMPFAAEFDPVYEAIEAACAKEEVRCIRADDIWINSTFIQDIFDLIFTSRIVVVDFSGRNSNVMYETGVAHTLGKVVVPITQSLDDIPSDLHPHRALKYYPNKEGLVELAEKLAKRIHTIMRGEKLA